MNKDAVFIYSESLLDYSFSKTHPFNQKRIMITLDLLKQLYAIQDTAIIAPRIATDEELLLAHDAKFIDIVKKAGDEKITDALGAIYGIGTEDTPIFPNMHEATATLVGGTLTAVDEVMSGRARHALHLGGGLHHGFKNRAAGFCIYNDIAIAIKYIQQKYGARVLYVDTDAHHGDGVQWAFYDDPTVCTLSIHETGRYLFPGTGDITERGNGPGLGTSFNFPIDAFTEDESFLEVYKTAITEVTKFFKPDVIFTQNGVDAHYLDPLTHLCGTMSIFKEIPKIAQALANEYCDGRWIAVGGGGYDIWRVVPRAWAHLWLTMNSSAPPTGPLPSTWLERWQTEAPVPLISTWEDPQPLYKSIPRKNEIENNNAKMLAKALQIIRT